MEGPAGQAGAGALHSLHPSTAQLCLVPGFLGLPCNPACTALRAGDTRLCHPCPAAPPAPGCRLEAESHEQMQNLFIAGRGRGSGSEGCWLQSQLLSRTWGAHALLHLQPCGTPPTPCPPLSRCPRPRIPVYPLVDPLDARAFRSLHPACILSPRAKASRSQTPASCGFWP